MPCMLYVPPKCHTRKAKESIYVEQEREAVRAKLLDGHMRYIGCQMLGHGACRQCRSRGGKNGGGRFSPAPEGVCSLSIFGVQMRGCRC